MTPGAKRLVSPHDRPVPAHQRLRLHDHQRLGEALLRHQRARQRQSLTLGQGMPFCQLPLQDQHLLIQRQHQAGAIVPEQQREPQIGGENNISITYQNMARRMPRRRRQVNPDGARTRASGLLRTSD